MWYLSTDVFIVCFSVVSPTSFTNVELKWLPEIRRLPPEAPIILVGTHIDLETNLAVILQLSNTNQEMVTMERALGLVKKAGIVCYIETSAVTQKNMKSVFDKAIMSVLRPPTSRSHPNVAPECCACM